MMKELIQQKDTQINGILHNAGEHNFIQQMFLYINGERRFSTLKVGGAQHSSLISIHIT